MNGTDDSLPVQELIRQREQLRGWLARLDEVAANAPGRVAQRVRGDYEERLRRVTAELGTHREELESGLAGVRAQLGEAEARRDGAQDALEEVRLRHLIGELDDAGWDDARPALENEVADADEALGRARDEVERLSRLLTEVTGAPPADDASEAADAALEDGGDGGFVAPPLADLAETDVVEQAAAAEYEMGDEVDEWEPTVPAEAAPGDLHEPRVERGPTSGLPDPFQDAPPAAPAADAAGDPFGGEFGGAAEAPAAASDPKADDEDLPWLDALDEGPAAWQAPAESDGLEFLNEIPETRGGAPADDGLAEDDLAFLEELDRAISGNAPATPPPAAGGAATPPPAAPAGGTPAGRLICKECGAPNEPHSWYCEVCGSEL